MAFNTQAVIKTAVAAVLKMAEADMPAYYDTHIPAAHNVAYYEVVGKLLRRGFRLNEDILLFDRGAEFEKDIAVYGTLMRSGAYASVDPAILHALDRREELDSVLVFVAGVWCQPPSGMPGTTTTAGPRAADADGVFNWDPEGDPTDYGIRW